MSDRLPVDYYAFPIDLEALPEAFARTIRMATTDHQYWFIEHHHASAGPLSPVWQRAADWCGDQFGVFGSQWSYFVSETKFCYFTFATSRDAFAFKLRWC